MADVYVGSSTVSDSVILFTERRKGSPKNLVGFFERREDRVELLLAWSFPVGSVVSSP